MICIKLKKKELKFGKGGVVITLEASGFETSGKIIAVEGNWVKVQGKKNLRIINGDMITEIMIVPEYL